MKFDLRRLRETICTFRAYKNLRQWGGLILSFDRLYKIKLEVVERRGKGDVSKENPCTKLPFYSITRDEYIYTQKLIVMVTQGSMQPCN